MKLSIKFSVYKFVHNCLNYILWKAIKSITIWIYSHENIIDTIFANELWNLKMFVHPYILRPDLSVNGAVFSELASSYGICIFIREYYTQQFIGHVRCQDDWNRHLLLSCSCLPSGTSSGRLWSNKLQPASSS